MLQISIWGALRELGVGASIHHYNPVIDDRMKAMFDLPEDYVLIAQMPFGGIGGDPRVKDPQNVMDRIKICK
jgi:predicted oxidoreductase (fatty acid repression mutant protein)